MKIISSAVFSDLPKQELQDRTAIMIDALRASATIITAISNGCDRMVPTEEADVYKRQLQESRAAVISRKRYATSYWILRIRK